MSRLDDALHEAFRREDPGPDFTSRVLARAAAAPPPPRKWWERLVESLRPPKLRWALAGSLACLFVVAGSVEYRQQQTRIEGEKAKDQLVLALRIAGTKLNQTREKVREVGGTELHAIP